MFRKIVICLIILVAIYMLGVEPFWMKKVERSLTVAGLTQAVRVLFLSDLQLRGKSGYRERWILKQLATERMDLIVTTGDLFDTAEGMPAAKQFLEQVAHLAPTVAILGNWEHWAKVDLEKYRADLKALGIPLLINEHLNLSIKDQHIFIVGVDDPSQNLHNLPLALKGVPEDSVTVLLAHGPIIFPVAAANGIDLMLAGHTHGGQIRIPFMPPFFLPPGCGPYFYGVYKEKQSTLVVTSGVGTSIFPIRFWCRPEIVFLNLKPGN